MLNKNNNLEYNLINNNHFFCISHFNGEKDWIFKLKKNKYIIYNKSGKNLPKEFNHINIKNVGYNIYSYLKYIVDNYENLPETVVFCKDNVFKRHIDINLFNKLLKRNTFTCIEEKFTNHKFPRTLKISDSGFIEINSSWFKSKYPRLFFGDFNCFYQYIFKNVENPNFLRFAPGANYIVPKRNILLRSKNFYINLISFINHSQFSCESHFLERSLYAIWNSNIESSDKMNTKLELSEIDLLKSKCLKFIKKENIILEKIYQKIIFKIGSIYMSFLLKKSIE